MLPTWHPEIKYMDVSIENPECMQMQTSYHSEFIEAPNGCYKLRVIIKTDAAKETMSMHIGPVTSLKCIGSHSFCKALTMYWNRTRIMNP